MERRFGWLRLVPYDDESVRSVTAPILTRVGAVRASATAARVRDTVRAVAGRCRVAFGTSRTAAAQAAGPRQAGLRGRRAASSAPADGGRSAQRDRLPPADRVEPHAVAAVARFVAAGRADPRAVVAGLGLAPSSTAGRVIGLITAVIPLTVGT